MTLEQVAKRAGVSTATVSRVMNNVTVVRESTRRRVLAAAKELDYRPNRHAQSLAGGRSRTLGIVVSNIEKPVLPRHSARGREQGRRERIRDRLREHRLPAQAARGRRAHDEDSSFGGAGARRLGKQRRSLATAAGLEAARRLLRLQGHRSPGGPHPRALREGDRAHG